MKPKQIVFALIAIGFAVVSWPTLPFVPAPDATPGLIGRDTVIAAAWIITIALCCIFLLQQECKVIWAALILMLSYLPLLVITLWDFAPDPSRDTYASYHIFAQSLERLARRLPDIASSLVVVRLLSLIVLPRILTLRR